MLESTMMLPLPRSAIPRAKARTTLNVPRRLRPITRSNSSSVMSSIRLRTLIAGVTTRMSGATASASAVTLLGSVISTVASLA
jgi:hypothetical protein